MICKCFDISSTTRCKFYLPDMLVTFARGINKSPVELWELLYGDLNVLPVCVFSKEFKKGNRVCLTPVLKLWGGGHIDHHLWK